MDTNARELVRSLFAAITATIEETHECAVAAQATGLTSREYRAICQRLTRSLSQTSALVDAARYLAERSEDLGE